MTFQQSERGVHLKINILEDISEIRKYFKPIQPTVGLHDEQVVYQEFAPAFHLQNFIHCYWVLRTKKRMNVPFDYRVVSDGCIDIVFNLKNTNESFVMGFHNKSTEFSLGSEFAYGGIRFYPSIFPSLFKLSAKSLTNKEQKLQLILPSLAEFISVNLKKDFHLAIPKINLFLKSFLQNKAHQIDDRFYEAFIEILKKRGHLEIEKALKTGLSPRQLRRFFDYYIGTSPKSFCQVVRFQYILNAKLASNEPIDHKIFFEVGFFDQAHFIKNFTRFYGISPSKAFK